MVALKADQLLLLAKQNKIAWILKSVLFEFTSQATQLSDRQITVEMWEKYRSSKYLPFIWQQLAELPQFSRRKAATTSRFDFFNHLLYRPVQRGGETNGLAVILMFLLRVGIANDWCDFDTFT